MKSWKEGNPVSSDLAPFWGIMLFEDLSPQRRVGFSHTQNLLLLLSPSPFRHIGTGCVIAVSSGRKPVACRMVASGVCTPVAAVEVAGHGNNSIF